MTEGVPDRLFVVSKAGSNLAYIAFWRREGAVAWVRAQGGFDGWFISEAAIYPAFPSGPWHAQVPITEVPTVEAGRPTRMTCVVCLGTGHFPGPGEGWCPNCEPALAARAREGGDV